MVSVFVYCVDVGLASPWWVEQAYKFVFDENVTEFTTDACNTRDVCVSN